MDLLILQHEPETPAGTTLEWAKSRGLSFDVIDTTKGNLSLSPTRGLVVCGGSMNVDEEHQHPWLREEKQFLRKALSDNRKIMGLCLGAQLLAEVLGAKVGPMGKWENGWHEVSFNGHTIVPFHFHRYNFEIPAGAEKIASSQACPNQAFRWRNNVVGVQFHPEVDARWIDLSLEDYAFQASFGVQTREQILTDNPRYLPVIRDWYFSFLDAWWTTA